MYDIEDYWEKAYRKTWHIHTTSHVEMIGDVAVNYLHHGRWKFTSLAGFYSMPGKYCIGLPKSEYFESKNYDHLFCTLTCGECGYLVWTRYGDTHCRYEIWRLYPGKEGKAGEWWHVRAPRPLKVFGTLLAAKSWCLGRLG